MRCRLFDVCWPSSSSLQCYSDRVGGGSDDASKRRSFLPSLTTRYTRLIELQQQSSEMTTQRTWHSQRNTPISVWWWCGWPSGIKAIQTNKVHLVSCHLRIIVFFYRRCPTRFHQNSISPAEITNKQERMKRDEELQTMPLMSFLRVSTRLTTSVLSLWLDWALSSTVWLSRARFTLTSVFFFWEKKKQRFRIRRYNLRASPEQGCLLYKT